MLEKYFVRPETVDRFHSSWIAEPIEKYVVWLHDRRYRSRSVCRRVPIVRRFGVGRRVYRLDEDRAEAKAVTDAAGRSTGGGLLRGQARARGYQRGTVEDGAWFYDYVKAFASVGIDVHLTFSGAELFSDTARSVQLDQLVFLRGRKALKLRQVPPVLLSECYDLAEIAALGGS